MEDSSTEYDTIAIMDSLIPIQVSVPLHCLAVMMSLLGNLSMLIIVCRVPMLHTPSFVLLSSLATVDIVLALVWNLTSLLVDMEAVDGHVTLSPGSVSCTAIGMVWQTAVSASALLQATIACDRYVFIVHPFKYQRHVTSGRAAACCTFILVLAVSLPASLFISGDPYRLEDPTRTCMRSTLWPLLFLTLILCPSLSLVIFSSQRVWLLYSRMLHQIELLALQDSNPSTSMGCVDHKLRNPLPSHLPEPRKAFLKKVTQAIKKRKKLVRTAKIAPQVSASKVDLNAAPTVMITICEKKDCPQTVHPAHSRSYEGAERIQQHPTYGLPPIDEPCLDPTPAFTRQNSMERVTSPCSSCTSGDKFSRSTSPADKSSRYLTPYSHQSHRPSPCSDDTSRSCHSSPASLVYSESSASHQAWVHSSDAMGCSLSGSDMGRGVFSSNQSLSSSTTSMFRAQSSAPVLNILTEDTFPEETNPISTLVSTIMVMPEIFLVQSASSGMGSSISSSRSLKNKKSTIAALHWAAVGNPVIAWVMALQADRAMAMSHHNSKRVKAHRLGDTSQLDIRDAGDVGDLSHSSLGTDARTACTAKCNAVKAFLLLWIPLILITTSFLPLAIVLISWEFGERGQFSAKCVYIVCFLTYTAVPSLSSLLLCLINKSYRRVLQRYICCLKKKRAKL